MDIQELIWFLTGPCLKNLLGSLLPAIGEEAPQRRRVEVGSSTPTTVYVIATKRVKLHLNSLGPHG